jgi:hypothetical protein
MDTVILEEPVACISRTEGYFSFLKIGAAGSKLQFGKSNITLRFVKAFLYLQFTGLDIADISMPLQSIAMELCTHKSGNSVVLMRTFVEGIQDIIDVSPSFQLSEYSLLGEFIN